MLVKELDVLNRPSENGSASKASLMKIVSFTGCSCSRGFFLHKATLGNEISGLCSSSRRKILQVYMDRIATVCSRRSLKNIFM